MSVYSTNQNRQLFVATGVADATPSTLGYVQVKTDADGGRFIIQKGHGGLVRSDIIYPGSVMWATASAPADTNIVLKAKKLSLKSTVNSGNPIPGQDYIVRINFRQLYGMSDEDIYQKYGAVHAATSSTTDFYHAMAYSLIKNFSRVYSPLLKIGFTGVDDSTPIFNIIKTVTKTGDSYNFTYESGTTIAAPTGLIIAEASQVDEWSLGTKPYTPVYFEVIPTTVYISATNSEVEWGTVEDFTDTYGQTVKNGYKYADLEYFCMGERADQYRNIGWPNAIQTKYMITNPDTQWYSLDIHYAYQGTCEDIQKSEKTMTILAASKDTINAIAADLDLDKTYKMKSTDAYDGTKDNAFEYPKYPTSGVPIGKL